jgi:hypothetical protein
MSSELLTIVVPLAAVAAVGIWWAILLRRRAK